MSELIPILLVDDQASNLTALEAILASSGCQLVTAQSADEALLALLDRDFAAIVLDIRMPGMSGFELASLIRQRKRTQHVPILFLTAYLLDQADVQRGYEAGAVDYLTKPISPVVLQSKISVFAELYRKRRELAIVNESLQREVAEREEAQEALKRANQVLESRVVERTDALSQAHRAVRENEERLRLALDAARMGFWIWEVQPDVLTWSPSPVRLTGRGRTFQSGLADLLGLVHEADRATLDRAFRNSFVSNGECRCEVRFAGPDGSIRWALVAGKVVTDNRGNPSRVAGIDLDITDRKKAEDALREADRRKDEFLAMLAHELRNPLAPLANAFHIIKLRGPELPEVAWARGVIERQLQQMTRLIDDLLDVSRISRGKLELKKTRVTLESVVKVAVETSAPMIRARGQTLEVTIPAEEIELDADATRLAQSLMNLLNNSAKYTDHGGTIRITAVRDHDDIALSVKDTGIGIPPDMLSRVFDMFAQVDDTLERSEGGLGVGLALVKKIIEMHGGSVAARSDGPGTGSEFTIRLPIDRAAPRDSGGTRSEAPAPGAAKHRILVAEDGLDAAESFGMLLRIMGHDVEVVHDGHAAVTTAVTFRPNVIIMDLGMPRLNGYDAARNIRAQPWGKDVVLIALTGWGQQEDRRRSSEAGFDQHLTKPVDPAALRLFLSSLAEK